MSAAELACRLDVPTNRITEILNGRRAITGDTALRLAHFFGTTAQFWLDLQSLYEIRLAQRKSGKSIRRCRRSIASIRFTRRGELATIQDFFVEFNPHVAMR
jgi:addiction module HigA family antidote